MFRGKKFNIPSPQIQKRITFSYLSMNRCNENNTHKPARRDDTMSLYPHDVLLGRSVGY